MSYNHVCKETLHFLCFMSDINRLRNLFALRKHAYSSILKILQPKNENFQIKNSDIFHIIAQNIDCGYSLEPPHQGGSNECHNLCCF